jgi:hypothetical protein
MNPRRRRDVRWFLFVPLLFLLPPFSPAAVPLASFPEIHSPVEADYAQYQLKFTYLGAQKKAVSSMAATGIGRAFVLDEFVPYERALDYGNDEFTGDTLIVVPLEFKAFLDAIALHPALQDTVFLPDPNVSLMIFRTSPTGPRCWEHLATREETKQLFQLLRDSLASPADRDRVDRFRRQMAGVRP